MMSKSVPALALIVVVISGCSIGLDSQAHLDLVLTGDPTANAARFVLSAVGPDGTRIETESSAAAIALTLPMPGDWTIAATAYSADGSVNGAGSRGLSTETDGPETLPLSAPSMDVSVVWTGDTDLDLGVGILDLGETATLEAEGAPDGSQPIWYLDGGRYATGQELTLDAAELAPGDYGIDLVVFSGDFAGSTSIDIRVSDRIAIIE